MHAEDEQREKSGKHEQAGSRAHQQSNSLPFCGVNLVEGEVGVAGRRDLAALVETQPEGGDRVVAAIGGLSLQPVGEVEPQ